MIQQTDGNDRFFAHGKLLLSGEYAVLHGATALALPLRFGQSMAVTDSGQENFVWQAYRPDGLWFAAEWDASGHIRQTTDAQLSTRLTEILAHALAASDRYSRFPTGKEIITRLEFNPEWGWGSSSTLIYNLSRWLQIDPYRLLRLTFGGSGYDIACAGASSALFYTKCEHKAVVEPAPFNPPFADNLWFIYLGKKQSSREAISGFRSPASVSSSVIRDISSLSLQMAESRSVDEFCACMALHEEITAKLTGLQPVQQRLFPGFSGAIKSLGAWGGDFVMACSDWPEEKIRDYFKTAGLDTVFNLKDIIANNND